MEISIRLTWDRQAGVWIAGSDDVPGLVLEDPSREALLERLRQAVPELLELNGKESAEELTMTVMECRRERWCKIMSANAFVDNAKVMAKGQITIPKDIRDVLGVSNGDRVTFIVEGNTVRMVNSAVYAMQVLQQEMAGEAERTGLTSEDDVRTLVKELRNEDNRQERSD